MSKADKMFEELGYKDEFNVALGYQEYIQKDKAKESDEWTISFHKNKTVRCSTYNNINRIEVPLAVTMQELQAINEKVKELGWYE